MARSLHVRLDADSEAALDLVRAADGGSDSEAVRRALREAGARRVRRASLAAESAVLREDPQDAAELDAVREQMAALAPDPDDL